MVRLKLPGPMLCGMLTVATNWSGWLVCCMGIWSGRPRGVPTSVAAVAFPPAVTELHETTNVVAVPGAVGFGVTVASGLLVTSDRLWFGRTPLASAAGTGPASAATVRPAAAATDLARRIDHSPNQNAPASQRIPGGRVRKLKIIFRNAATPDLAAGFSALVSCIVPEQAQGGR